MNEELLTRVIYGLSLMVHNIFAGLPLGMAVIHCLYSFYQYNKDWEKGISSVRLTLDLLVLSILLAVLAGFAFEIEFLRFWSAFGSALDIWNEHLGHKSAVIGFFISSALIVITYYFQLWRKPLLYLILSICWIFLAWLFSVWGIFLNTVMQYPHNASIVDGVLVINSSLTELFFSGYHIIRQSHIALASVLKAGIITLLLWAYCNKTLLSNSRFVILILLISLAGLGITGHFQAQNVAEHQPSKFAAMEGLLFPSDTSHWHVIGFIGFDGKIRSLPIKGGLQLMTDNKLTSFHEIREDERPSLIMVFNSFRIMIYSFISIFAMTLFLLFRKNQLVVPVLIILLILTELAINSGWLLTESGRQPWMFYGLLKREFVRVPFVNMSAIILCFNIILLFASTILGIKILKKHHV